jgi:AGCS family alanine or glycine:cation symporter
MALMENLGSFGPVFITIAMVLFAFTTLLGNLYYVDKSIVHLYGKMPERKFVILYYISASLVIFIGAVLDASLLWNVADVFMGLMTIINMPVIIILSKYAIMALKDYEKQRKEGKDPVFYAKNIDLPIDVECWK